jgi:hypothetical protein
MRSSIYHENVAADFIDQATVRVGVAVIHNAGETLYRALDVS